ncbi:hypothetical protein B0H19DRAFT_1079414 [Mycena capillaripes]|nr:hypothetical protein B0H19DRAFT_1079414 [Mycena capillaripes]
MDALYILLVLSLIISNLSRILQLFQRLLQYLARPRNPQLVPYYNERGELHGMVRLDPTFLRAQPPHRRADEYAIPEDASQKMRPQMSQSAPSPLLFLLRNMSHIFIHERSHESNQPRNNFQSASPSNWDCWPDGKFEFLAPASRAVERHKQQQYLCALCGEELVLRKCGIESSLYRFRDGGFFVHGGIHTHKRFTHSSVTRPNGTLGFVDHISKYNAPSIEPRSRTLGLPSVNESSESEWEGITDFTTVSEPFAASPDSDGKSDDSAAAWEMQEDPDAEVDELEEEED